VRLAALQSLVGDRVPGHRVPRSRPGVGISASPPRCSRHRRALVCDLLTGVILSCAFASSSELVPPRLPACPAAGTPRAPPLGFRPSSRPQRKRPSARASRSRSSRPRRFSRPRRLMLRIPPRGYLSPRCHVQGSLFRVSADAQPHGLSPAVPFLPFASSPCRIRCGSRLPRPASRSCSARQAATGRKCCDPRGPLVRFSFLGRDRPFKGSWPVPPGKSGASFALLTARERRQRNW
jgi:hypothetical protein